MKPVRLMMLASVITLSALYAHAQPAKGMESGNGTSPLSSGPAASAVGMGPGAGHGAMRWGSDNTPGWSLMTPQERDQHREKMLAMKNQNDCKAYVAKHHEEMAARAKARGAKVPTMPRRDPCARLPQ